MLKFIVSAVLATALTASSVIAQNTEYGSQDFTSGYVEFRDSMITEDAETFVSLLPTAAFRIFLSLGQSEEEARSAFLGATERVNAERDIRYTEIFWSTSHCDINAEEPQDRYCSGVIMSMSTRRGISSVAQVSIVAIHENERWFFHPVPRAEEIAFYQENYPQLGTADLRIAWNVPHY